MENPAILKEVRVNEVRLTDSKLRMVRYRVISAGIQRSNPRVMMLMGVKRIVTMGWMSSSMAVNTRAIAAKF